MARASAPVWGAAFVLLLVGSQARADFINWTYSWTRSPNVVTADGSGTGKIFLTPVSGSALGTSDIGAVTISTSSSASAGNPDTFTAKGYGLTVNLTDVASHATGSLTFTGNLNGTLSANSSNLTTTFNSPLVQTIVLGNNSYTVSLNVPPGPSSTLGGIGAHVVVGPTKVNNTPEPSSLILAGLGTPLLLRAAWRRRQRRPETTVFAA
jgi:hypothetical protein